MTARTLVDKCHIGAFQFPPLRGHLLENVTLERSNFLRYVATYSKMSHWSVPISSATWPLTRKCHIGAFQFPPLRGHLLENVTLERSNFLHYVAIDSKIIHTLGVYMLQEKLVSNKGLSQIPKTHLCYHYW